MTGCLGSEPKGGSCWAAVYHVTWSALRKKEKVGTIENNAWTPIRKPTRLGTKPNPFKENALTTVSCVVELDRPGPKASLRVALLPIR